MILRFFLARVFVTRGVVLDIDDTLYLERDYVRSGLRAVGNHLVSNGHAQDFFDRAWALFESGRRKTLFNDLLPDFSLAQIAELLEVYRTHRPLLELCPDAARFLARCPTDRPIGIITDGPPSSQMAKVQALGLLPRADPIILSDSFGVEFRKPHVRPYREIEEAWTMGPALLTYIADNPGKDFITPRQRGWRTIRIRRALGEHAKVDPVSPDYDADFVIESFDELYFD